MAQETYEVMQARMQKAFNLVAPKEHWKNPVRCEVTSNQLEEAGLTIQQVCESVVYFTGTQALARLITKNPITGTEFFMVTAPGYYAGPCN
jgi:hypothetical protein